MPEQIFVSALSSPLGELSAGITDHGLAFLQFQEGNKRSRLIEQFAAQHGLNLIRAPHSYSEKVEHALNIYFDEDPTQLDIELDIRGSEFQVSVWKALLSIPLGKTRTYADQAKALGNLKAIRAVATANGANPISIIVPCHRVIGSDGSLTGYMGGLQRKAFLLELEQKMVGGPVQQRLFD